MNPIQIIEKFMVGNNNPMFSNLLNLAKNGKHEDIKNIARNICNERGINFDKEFPDFMKKFK